ncbi:MAG: response regulator [Bacteroidota bacterium]
MNSKAFPLSEEVLIVEDSRIVQSIMKKTISLVTNTKILQANNGAEGLKIVEESPYLFKAVLLDLAMPVLHGVEFMHHIRALDNNKAQTVVIAITGNQSNLSDAEMQDIGLNGAIIKPIDMSKLFGILAEIPSHPPDHWYGIIKN